LHVGGFSLKHLFHNTTTFQAGFKALVEATRSSNGLPTGQKWDYYATFPSFKKVMDAEGERVLKL
jgi:hypothetical protein